jgi:hypothetical protein
MYPVKYSADYVETRSRLTTFFRPLMVIPALIVAFFWVLAAEFATFAAWFALLFTGRYPRGLYDFNVKALRMMQRVSSYCYLLTDVYPPFNGDDDPSYPVRVAVAPPLQEYSRAKVFLRLLLAIPVFVMQYLYRIVSNFVGVVSWIVIVVTGKQPQGLQDLQRMAVSYNTKAQAYLFLLTEDYPPITDQAQLETGEPTPQFGVQ